MNKLLTTVRKITVEAHEIAASRESKTIEGDRFLDDLISWIFLQGESDVLKWPSILGEFAPERGLYLGRLSVDGVPIKNLFDEVVPNPRIDVRKAYGQQLFLELNIRSFSELLKRAAPAGVYDHPEFEYFMSGSSLFGRTRAAIVVYEQKLVLAGFFHKENNDIASIKAAITPEARLAQIIEVLIRNRMIVGLHHPYFGTRGDAHEYPMEPMVQQGIHYLIATLAYIKSERSHIDLTLLAREILPKLQAAGREDREREPLADRLRRLDPAAARELERASNLFRFTPAEEKYGGLLLNYIEANFPHLMPFFTASEEASLAAFFSDFDGLPSRFFKIPDS